MEGTIHRFRVHRANPAESKSRTNSDVTSSSSPAVRRPSTLPACRRCRQQKKRCTRTAEGPCKPCLQAWLPCSLMERSASPQTRERELRSRIDWLSQLVNQTLPGESRIESVETGRDLVLGTNKNSLTPVEVIDSDREDDPAPGFSKDNGDGPMCVTSSRACLQAYFRHVHRAYPFVDSESVLLDFDILCDENAENEYIPRHMVSSRLQMIMAIGFTTLQRAGEAQEINAAFDPCLKLILHECLCRIDEHSAGTLLLLGLYLLFLPSDIDPRAVAGVLTRHALTIGLINETPNNQPLTARALELRRRLSWSIYAFDRMVSISYGIPFSFPDDRMQVPLPSIMIHEYASGEGHQYTIALQVSRHIISLRQLETRIINAIYDIGSSQRHKGLRREIEDWYTQGCLLSSSAMWDQDQLPFHTTITWLNVRYQNLLLLLYSPAQGGLPVEDHLSTLQGAAQQYIQLSLILHEHRHLPMNWISLCRLLSLSATFFYCVTSWSTPPLQGIPEIGLLASLLDFFPEAWTAAHEGSQIVQRLADIVTKQIASTIPLSQSPGSSVIAGSLDAEGLQSIQDDLEKTLSKTLGEASFYVWPLRSKVVERRASQIAVMNDINAALYGGDLAGTLTSAPEQGVQTVTPLEAVQWVNLLGGLGSDMH